MYTYIKKNDTGKILLSRAVIGNIIINTVDKLEGKAVLCNSKGKSGYNEKKNMTFFEAVSNEDGLYIKIYILMKFGAGISKITSSIIDNVKNDVTVSLGVEPKTVSLVIKGVFSKNTVRRNIEVVK